jgi:phage-related protein
MSGDAVMRSGPETGARQPARRRNLKSARRCGIVQRTRDRINRLAVTELVHIGHPHGLAGYLIFAMIQSMRWTVEILNATVLAEMDALPDDMRARLGRYFGLIQEVGLQALPREAVKHLEDKLWELRVSGRDGISRAIYVTASGRRVVILRAFVKKAQRTPLRELEVARQRAKEVR